MCDQPYGLIGLDLGTSMLKGAVISLSGRLVASGQIGMDYQTDGPVCEFDAEQFYGRLTSLIRQLVTALPAPMNLLGLSIASASGNTMLVGRDGRPLRPAISWLDQRLNQHQEENPDQVWDPGADAILSRFDPAETHRIVGWPYLRSFPLAHLAWLKAHQSELLAKAEKVCLSTDYVTYRLTGEWGIDPSTATTFYLQDQVRQQWHQPFLDELDLKQAQLPAIKETGTLLGRVTEQAAAETSLPAGLPVVLGAFDHPCAARGCGVLAAGQVMLSAGTSWVLFFPEPDRDLLVRQQLLCDPFLHWSGFWGGMASIEAVSRKIDRLILRWISDRADRLDTFTELARQAPAGASGLIIRPDLADETSDFSGYARPDIARALMEGTAFLLTARLAQLKKAGIQAESLTMVGGAARNAVWAEIVCHVLGQPITVIGDAFSGAVGAAIVAGCGVGAFADEQTAARQIQQQHTRLLPDQKMHEQYVQLIQEHF